MGKFHFFDFLVFLMPGLMFWAGLYLLFDLYGLMPDVLAEKDFSTFSIAGIGVPVAYITGHVFRWFQKEAGQIDGKYHAYHVIAKRPLLQEKLLLQPEAQGVGLGACNSPQWKVFYADMLYALRISDRSEVVDILEAQYKFMLGCGQASTCLLIANFVGCWLSDNLVLCSCISLLLMPVVAACFMLAFSRHKTCVLERCNLWLRLKSQQNS